MQTGEHAKPDPEPFCTPSGGPGGNWRQLRRHASLGRLCLWDTDAEGGWVLVGATVVGPDAGRWGEGGGGRRIPVSLSVVPQWPVAGNVRPRAFTFLPSLGPVLTPAQCILQHLEKHRMVLYIDEYFTSQVLVGTWEVLVCCWCVCVCE